MSTTIQLKPEVIEFLEQGNVELNGEVKTYHTAQGSFQQTEEEGVYAILQEEDTPKSRVEEELDELTQRYNKLVVFNSKPTPDFITNEMADLLLSQEKIMLKYIGVLSTRLSLM